MNQVNLNLSSYYGFKEGISIPKDADMQSETYKIPGNYFCQTNVLAETLKNCPISSAFTLKVYYSTGIENNYIIQEYTGYDGNTKKIKFHNERTSSWSSNGFVMDSDLDEVNRKLLYVAKFKSSPFDLAAGETKLIGIPLTGLNAKQVVTSVVSPTGGMPFALTAYSTTLTEVQSYVRAEQNMQGRIVNATVFYYK